MVEIIFSKREATNIHPYNDDPMVITMRCDEWKIKRVLVDQGSFAYILYWDAFERLRLDQDYLKAFKGSLVGFPEKHVQVKVYTTLKITFRDGDQPKQIRVRYLVL